MTTVDEQAPLGIERRTGHQDGPSPTMTNACTGDPETRLATSTGNRPKHLLRVGGEEWFGIGDRS